MGVRIACAKGQGVLHERAARRPRSKVQTDVSRNQPGAPQPCCSAPDSRMHRRTEDGGEDGGEERRTDGWMDGHPSHQWGGPRQMTLELTPGPPLPAWLGGRDKAPSGVPRSGPQKLERDEPRVSQGPGLGCPTGCPPACPPGYPPGYLPGCPLGVHWVSTGVSTRVSAGVSTGVQEIPPQSPRTRQAASVLLDRS